MNTWKSEARFASVNYSEWIVDCLRPLHNEIYSSALEGLTESLEEKDELQLINKTTGEIVWQTIRS